MSLKQAISTLASFCILANSTATGWTQTNKWASGRDFSNARQQSVVVSWNHAPLRAALDNLSHRQRIPIFLDRRVDPSQPIDFDSNHGTFEQTLLQLADSLDLGVERVAESYYYVGPRQAVAELRYRRKELMEEIDRLPREHKRDWLAKQTLRLDYLEEPADAYANLERPRHLNISFGEKIPYDLWPEIDLPALTLIDRMIVLSYGFGLWIKLNNNDTTQAALVKTKPLAEFEQDHAKRINEEQLQILREQYPSVAIAQGEKTRVTAPAFVHYEIERMLDNGTVKRSYRPERKDGQVVVDFSTGDQDAAIGSILTKIAEANRVELKFEPEMRQILETRIKLKLRRVTYDELLKETLAPVGLNFEFTDSELRITR
ncbi:MAG TPA: hypothetical protein PKD64_14890 [Pirellulaceae bacterium]|nr:hypothetical protein [Pirellulaceae bacterium]HMO93469.1 hypothetical protein [Pirellulaceae bacterium]HMP69216.1 hypothetical protein [Pirellulaceae bacterium]